MALELVECPYCHYKFRIDLKALQNDGESIVVRGLFRREPKPVVCAKSIDIECPNCKKIFEQEVKS
jgi:DNA-directed RNA polymerase subunit RPC12/RpoP